MKIFENGLNINDNDFKILQTYETDLEQKIKDTVDGWVTFYKDKMIKEWTPKIFITNVDTFVGLVTSHPDYKTKEEQEADKK